MITDDIQPKETPPPKRLRMPLPRDIYKKVLKEAVDREVAPTEVVIIALVQYFAGAHGESR